MGGPRYKVLIELFRERTGEVVKLKRFHNQAEFEEFLNSFRRMRYPGYSWRYKNIQKKQSSIDKVEKE